MIDGRLIAVVVPAFNEARWIAEVVASMPSYVDHIVVVDDASKDDTAAIASARAANRAVSVTRHLDNRGVGAAIVSGYRVALERGAEVVAVMAGDGQMHPDDLQSVLRPVLDGTADYVKGNRLQHPLRPHMPRHRRWGSAALAYLTSWAAGVAVGDSQCGFTAISADALRALDLAALWPHYGYPNDLIGALARIECQISEVVVRPVYRGEASGLRPYHLATIAYVVARVAWRRRAPSGRRAGAPVQRAWIRP